MDSRLKKTPLLYLISLFFFIFPSPCISQSTTSNPQGHCSNYLNRYTSQDQCIYSFIVPKKDSDQCLGLAAQVEDLKDQLNDMRQWKESVDTNIRLLLDRSKNVRKPGRCEAEARILKDQRNNLTASNNRLVAERARLTNEVRQISIDAQEYQSQLELIGNMHGPLQRNYTQLSDQYRAMQQQLDVIQARYDRLSAVHTELVKTKNCSDVNKHLPSCAVIKQWGYTTSGDAMIDPDGEGGVDPFLVYCDMDTDPSTGITVIKHNNNAKHPVYGCEAAGCFSLPVNYNGVTLLQIEKLMGISLACEQFIRYDCFDSKLLKDNTAWWVSRRGEKMRYWGGASPGSNMCECGTNNNCVSQTERCNCDSDREQWDFDEGILRDKATLPVTNLNFGDVNDNAGERGNVTLGELRCKWNINISVPSCGALREAGVTGSGFFLVDSDGVGGEVPRQTLCTLPDTIQPSKNGSVTPIVPIRSHNPNEYRFTHCGKQIGNTGPTEIECNNTYRGSNLKVRVTNGRQFWRVPMSGNYRVRASAPSGYHSEPARAGRGAEMQAEFALRRNDEIWVIVGQKGNAHAGSGGTFVVQVRETYTLYPLIVAGGGGSSTASGTRPAVLDASENHRAKDSSLTGRNAGLSFGTGGDNGNGGLRGGSLTGPNTAGGGAGFNTDGAKSSDDRFTPLPSKAIKINSNAAGNLAPGTGGTYTYLTNGNSKRELHGGFGGGGSASKSGPGGAGGYSGGGGGPANGYAGGGGSHVAVEGSKESFQLNQQQEGEVKFIYLGPLPEADT